MYKVIKTYFIELYTEIELNIKSIHLLCTLLQPMCTYAIKYLRDHLKFSNEH